MVTTADAATYELLKSAMMKYYRDFDPTLGAATITEKSLRNLMQPAKL